MIFMNFFVKRDLQLGKIFHSRLMTFATRNSQFRIWQSCLQTKMKLFEY